MSAAVAIRPPRMMHSESMHAKFVRELVAMGLDMRRNDTSDPVVTEADLAALPAPARQFMRFSGVVGRPRDWSFCARWDGRFRTGPKHGWSPCEVWQYNSNLEIARIFHMRLRMSGRPTYVRDVYSHNHGHMVGKVFDTFSVVDDACEKVSIGELVTYLNDCFMFAPSMLLDGRVEFYPVDDRSFDVTLCDHIACVTARVFVDEAGALCDFSTIDRFGQDPADPKPGLTRTRWSTPVGGWTCVDGRMRPTWARAIWHFPSGDFCYAEMVTDEMQFIANVTPQRLEALT